MALNFRRKKKDHLTEKQRSLITHYAPKSPISEQFRTIRTNLQFTSVDKPLRSLTVSSTSPGEGKSTTVANLAIVLAQQSHKVLIIDADMRKPTGHYTFMVNNDKGLTNVLTKQGEAMDMMQKTFIDGVHILTCGPIPPNPAELLGSKRMEWLLQEMLKQFDYVLVDSPPILAVTDAQVLANKTDGVVLVTSSGLTEKEAALKSKDLLDRAGANIAGVVLNRRNKKDNHYYYYYGNDN